MADGEGRRMVLVCESSQRWKRAIGYYLDRLQQPQQAISADSPSPHSIFNSVFVRGVSVGEARALMVHVRPLVVLWELAGSDMVQVAKAISIGGRSQHPPLQIACMPVRFQCSPYQASELAVDVRQLGVAALLQHPEELGLGIKLIERYFEGCALSTRSSAKSADLDNS